MQKKLATTSERSHNHISYDELAGYVHQPTGDPLPDFAVNHMSLARASYRQLLACASSLGCVGVELRNDRLGNSEQLDALHAGGYRGPVSFEAFSPTVHQLAEPAMALRELISFIESNQAVKAA